VGRAGEGTCDLRMISGTDACTGGALLTGLLLAGLGATGVALGRRRASARRDAVRD